MRKRRIRPYTRGRFFDEALAPFATVFWIVLAIAFLLRLFGISL